MRHQKYRNSLGLRASRRQAMLNNMAASLIRHNRIITTVKKAKVASRFADKLITLAKRKDLYARRQLFAHLKSRDLVKYLVDEVGPRFANRSGGYTRIIRYKHRNGDGALTAILEFTEIPIIEEKKKEKKRARKEQKKKERAEAKAAAKEAPAPEEKVAEPAAPAAEKPKKEAKPKKEEKAAEQPKAEEKDKDKKKDKKEGGFFQNLRGFLKK